MNRILKEQLLNLKDSLKREEINTYLKNQDYEGIYRKFGAETYRKCVPLLYELVDINNLKQSKNYDLIYKKYGESVYTRLKNIRLYNDVLNETGDVKLASYYKNMDSIRHIKAKSLKFAFKLAIGLTTLVVSTPLIVEVSSNNLIYENSIKYSKEINQYNQNLDEYVENFKKLATANNLSDLEIFMKVMDDLWNNIDGYGNPKIDAFGYLRLDMENGVGVCRNMADDITTKLNAINSDYNARNFTLYMNDNEYNKVDIETRRAKEENQDEITEASNHLDTTKIIGNHMVVLVDLKNEHITLVLDPTNVLIGVLKGGKIICLNSPDGRGYTNKIFGDGIMQGLNSYENQLEVNESILNLNSIDELIEKYGPAAQKIALNKIRNLDNNIKK